MMQDKKVNNVPNVKKPYLLVDSSYVSFHRFFSTLIWYNNVYPDDNKPDDYEWLDNEVFMKHFDETYMKNLLKFKNMYNIPFENIIMVRDCPRETIWRMEIYPEYKATRKNTCSFKNKKYNVGNIFKHIYNKLYPLLEKQYGFKIIKVENAEADDIIAVLSSQIRENDKNRLIVIISNDNDFLQLVDEKTLIWSLQNKLLNTKVEFSAEDILMKKILKGDESDNIPSIIGSMADKDLNDLIRDKKKFNIWLKENPDKQICYEKNRTLIDFKYIPINIKNAILNETKDIIPISEPTVVEQPVLIEIPKNIEEPKLQESKSLFSIDYWKNNSVIKIKPKIIAPIQQQENYHVKEQYFNYYNQQNTNSNFIHYRNYGNPNHHRNFLMTNTFFQKRHQNIAALNFATEDYYNY